VAGGIPCDRALLEPVQCLNIMSVLNAMRQAFVLYEDELTDSKTQIRALASMVGTLLKCRNFEEGDYDALITKTTQYAAKLLKKPDQCRMVTLCSHLFWVGAEVRGRIW
jgi:hypothetical protein